MKPPPPGPSDRAETSQAAAVPGRPAGNHFRAAGKWLFVLAWAVVVAGFVGYRLILGDDSDGMGLLATVMAVVTAGIAGPLGLIGAVLWSIGVVRAHRSGNGRS
ncbi:hypothetical protein ABIE09_002214 [Lysobacter enzymogenes]|uniref:hypothetical protein n=1 Tax=Lysobacter enzymogenes TaxID=69 RepID=UPI0033952978